MVEFHYEVDFKLKNEQKYSDWINRTIVSENAVLGKLNYIFCSDKYLWEINREHLAHDTYTDIITFDYTDGSLIGGDIFISVDRVIDNAKTYNVNFEDELLRVMVHGVLHLLGFGDKSDEEVVVMRRKENDKMKLFHVEQ